MDNYNRLCFMLYMIVLLDVVPSLPIFRRSVESDDEIPLEIPVEHFGLVDESGFLPRYPSLKHRTTHKQPESLKRAGKSKRDGPDIGEFYYDDIM
ncbi:protein Frey 1 [Pelobates fuscus]|uniref:protein Frey 1 n=1 Tax=Pelobates fuscus TaxID=191477 RepID=UPI002FE4F3F5